MSSAGLRVSNVTVEQSVRAAEDKILSEIPDPEPVATAVDDNSFISFNDINVSKELIITGDNAISMAKSGVLIVDYAPVIPNQSYYTLLFGLTNTPSDVSALAMIFKLSNLTPSRLIRVIRTGIAPFTVEKDTVLGTEAVVNTGVKYVYFQVNGVGEHTKTPEFTTISDWSFVISLKFDTIDGQEYSRICFNVLL